MQYIESAPSATGPVHPLVDDALPRIAFRKWVTTLLATTQVHQEVILLGLLFIYRLKVINHNVKGKPGSEYRLLTVALMLGNKYLDDNTYTNKTWAEVSGIAVNEIQLMEVEFLSNMRYNLYVRDADWQSWHKKLSWFYDYFERASQTPLPTPSAGPAHSSPSKGISPTLSSQHSSPYVYPMSPLHRTPSQAPAAMQAYHAPAAPTISWTGDVAATYPQQQARKRSRDDSFDEPPAKRMMSQPGIGQPRVANTQPGIPASLPTPNTSLLPPAGHPAQQHQLPPLPSSVMAPVPSARLPPAVHHLGAQHGPPAQRSMSGRAMASVYGPVPEATASPMHVPLPSQRHPAPLNVCTPPEHFYSRPAYTPHLSDLARYQPPSAPVYPASTPTTRYPISSAAGHAASSASYPAALAATAATTAVAATAPGALSLPYDPIAIPPSAGHSRTASPITTLTPTSAAYNSGPITPIAQQALPEQQHLSPAAMAFAHRASPYKPVYGVRTLLIPPPSASLNDVGRNVGQEDMRYLPLGKGTRERRVGVPPAYGYGLGRGAWDPYMGRR